MPFATGFATPTAATHVSAGSGPPASIPYRPGSPRKGLVHWGRNEAFPAQAPVVARATITVRICAWGTITEFPLSRKL